MDNIYNKQRHSELLKYSNDLAKQGKSLLKESKKEYDELFSYSTMVYSQLNWEKKSQYLELCKKFVEGDITIVQ